MAALGDLPERQRQVVALRILLELTGDETAAELGISPSTVGVHLHRALAALRLHALPLDPKDTP
jgi:RNA polymerase sigma-70 factor (ECF subfamily)